MIVQSRNPLVLTGSLYLTGGESFANGELAVREVQIQELPEVEGP